MKIQKNYSLRAHNTFGVEARAAYFMTIARADELLDLQSRRHESLYILGSGSNILFTQDINGLVLKIEIPGITAHEDSEEVLVEAGAGVNWHELVIWCVERGYCGIENLALIPGTAGAAPIQNIGAYGVELKDVFEYLEAIDLRTGKSRLYYKNECDFGYRTSFFKINKEYLITKITIRLSKEVRLKLEYGDIRKTLENMRIDKPGIRDVAEAVMVIRRSKLPDPNLIGNAGSFFKNPEVSIQDFEELKKGLPDIPHFPGRYDKVKVPAGFLIEKAGWKGRRVGRAACHEKQALVLLNLGGASGQEILDLAQKIRSDVQSRFGVLLESEVNIW